MHVEWQVLKASARGQVGQTIASELDDATDTDGLGELHPLRESVSASGRRVRFVPGSIEAWTDRARKAAVLGHPNVTPVIGIGASGAGVPG
nr:hypothetical protein [Deltaproteobacteria bacterium]